MAADLGLDPRLLRALGKKGFSELTPVQIEVIPKVRSTCAAGSFACIGLSINNICSDAPPPPPTPSPSLGIRSCGRSVQRPPQVLEGKDVVARARTGSGKTLAYLLPALHKVLTADRGRAGWQALVLVPTRELCEQVRGTETEWIHQLRH